MFIGFIGTPEDWSVDNSWQNLPIIFSSSADTHANMHPQTHREIAAWKFLFSINAQPHYKSPSAHLLMICLTPFPTHWPLDYFPFCQWLAFAMKHKPEISGLLSSSIHCWCLIVAMMLSSHTHFLLSRSLLLRGKESDSSSFDLFYLCHTHVAKAIWFFPFGNHIYGLHHPI